MSDRDLMLLRAKLKRQRRAKRFANHMLRITLGKLRGEMRLLADGVRRTALPVSITVTTTPDLPVRRIKHAQQIGRATRRITATALDVTLIDNDGTHYKLKPANPFASAEEEIAYRAKHGLIG